MYKKICWRWISLSFVLHYVEKWMYTPQFYFLRPNTCTLKHYELLCSNNVNLWKEALDLILRKSHEITIFPLLIWIYLQSIIFIIIKQTQPFIQNSACALILYILKWLSARGWKECALQRANINKWFFQLFPTVVTSSTNYKLFI